jgi:hypothetical protein
VTALAFVAWYLAFVLAAMITLAVITWRSRRPRSLRSLRELKTSKPLNFVPPGQDPR